MKEQVRATWKGRHAAAMAAGLRTLRHGAMAGASILLASTACQTLAADATVQPLANDTPKYFRYSYSAAMKSPLPFPGTINMPSQVQPSQNYLNAKGMSATWLTTGTVNTRDNAFFQSLGTNGRSCFSCHQPADGMSLNTGTIQLLFALTNGRDPIFAPVDGSNCPSSVPRTETVVSLLGGISGGGKQSLRDSHSLLLNKGLFRVFLPVPDNAEFTIHVDKDPYGCNTDGTNSQAKDLVTQDTKQMISVYRRPRMSANLKFVTAPALIASAPTSGNIMWDGREATLESQAKDATLGHAQAKKAPTDKQIAEIVAFENSIFAAQSWNLFAGDLTQNGGKGGPKPMASVSSSFSFVPGTGFDVYSGFPTAVASNATIPVKMRASIARGQALFNTRTIQVNDVPGFNDVIGASPVATTCASCHGNMPNGSDPFPLGQRDIGIGGSQAGKGGPKLATDLPQFTLTCTTASVASYNGKTVSTNDPGLALITGKCADIGRRSVPQLRALAARAPYFSDGSAPTLESVVSTYNNRFGIGLKADEITDLANFLAAL